MVHFRLRYERLRDDYQAFLRRRAIWRGLALGLLVPVAGLLIQAGFDVRPQPLLWWSAAIGLVVLTFVRASRARRPQALGEALDRQLRLDALLVTALEVDRRGPAAPVELRLLDDAATALAELGDLRPLVADEERRERESVLGLVLLVAGLWLVVGSRQALPATARLDGFGDRLAGLGSSSGRSGDAGDRSRTSGEFGQSDSGGPGTATDAERRMASALADQAAARPLADALARGEKSQAEAALRRLAGETAGLSAAGRKGLADGLFDAADQVADTNPALADAARRAGRSLERPDSEADAEGLAALAAALRPGSGKPPTPAPAESRQRSGPPAGRLASGSLVTTTLLGVSASVAQNPADTLDSNRSRDLPLESRSPGSAASTASQNGSASADLRQAPFGWQGALERYFGRR